MQSSLIGQLPIIVHRCVERDICISDIMRQISSIKDNAILIQIAKCSSEAVFHVNDMIGNIAMLNYTVSCIHFYRIIPISRHFPCGRISKKLKIDVVLEVFSTVFTAAKVRTNRILDQGIYIIKEKGLN